MKKTLSILLSIVMLLSITAGLNFSAYANTSGDYEYKLLNDGTAEITTYIGSESEVNIPSEIDGYTVTSIGEWAFDDCESLTSVTIPNSVTSIGIYAFEDCTGLTSITIPNSVTSIGEGTFSVCRSLTSVTIPNSVTRIGVNAFLFCMSLTSITIPNSVTSIGYAAFGYCTSLTSITIPNSVTSIEGRAFGDCTSLTSITVDANNKNYSSENGVLYNKNKTELILYPIGKTSVSFKIPNSVTSIGEGTFSDCTSLTSITIPNSVISIGDFAFCNCTSLTSVTIPNSVTSIGYGAFDNCTSLTSITIPNSVTSIGDYIFDYSVVIYGYKNSEAERYAKNHRNTFITLICEHTYKTTTTKATTKANGKIVKKCSVCNDSTTVIIYYPKSVTLSATSYTYNGKVRKPTVTVTDSKGKKIAASNYTVSYSSGRKNVGKYTVTIKFKGNYSGTVKKTFTIKPKATSISKVTAGRKAFTVKWKKQATQTTGYQIQYSTSSKFTAKTTKTVTVSKNKTTSKKISKLKAKKKYYVRVRTYKTVKVNGKNTKIYSGWSKVKTVKTK